jgi:arsenate reductase (thioredoxin)
MKLNAESRILILCTGNSCRSQMAEGWLRHLGCKNVWSAGLEAHGVNPRAIKAMAEAGVDISTHTSNVVEEYLGLEFDVVLTVCDHANETCPAFPSHAQKLHHSFPDPADARGAEDEILNEFRRVRDLIREYCQQMLS